MDVKQCQKGQSVLEFLMLLPFIIGLVMVLIRINAAIQISIVNQQYSRAAVLQVVENNAFYPDLEKQEAAILGKRMNQMVVGVSENQPEASGDYSPEAVKQLISRSKKIKGGSEAPGEEPDKRSNVRVRNSVTLCTPTYYLTAEGTAFRGIVKGGKDGQKVAKYHVGDNTKFGNSFCGGSIKYEQ